MIKATVFQENIDSSARQIRFAGLAVRATICLEKPCRSSSLATLRTEQLADLPRENGFIKKGQCIAKAS